MDLQGKAAYQAGNCGVCKGIKEGICFSCNKKIPRYMSESGASSPVIMNTGFRSPIVDHWHFKDVKGVTGTEAICPELCRDCYLTAYNSQYPERKLKKSELPQEFNLT